MSKKIDTPDFEIVWVSLSELELAPIIVNDWKTSENEGKPVYDFKRLKKDIQENGITEPITAVRRTGTKHWSEWELELEFVIREGQHRIYALKELYPDGIVKLTLVERGTDTYNIG